MLRCSRAKPQSEGVTPCAVPDHRSPGCLHKEKLIERDFKLTNESISKPVRYLLFATALLVALCLYTFHLSSDLYGDERGHTYNVVAMGDFWENLKNPSMCHPPLYFILAKISFLAVGEPWAMRIPSIVFSLGTVLLIAFAAKRILGGRFLLLSVWLAALSPFILEFSAEGRAYAMLIFFSVATFWAFIEFMEKENVGHMMLLAASSIGGALTHYFFWFQLIALMVLYLAYHKKITRYGSGVFIITAGVLIPVMIILFLVQEGEFTEYLQVEWSARYFSVTNFLGRLYMAVAYGFSTFKLPNLDPARNVPFVFVVKDNCILISFVIITLGGFVYALFKVAGEKRRLVWFCLLGILIPVLFGLIAGKSGLYLVREKHLGIIWVCYFFLLLLALDYLKNRKWGWIIIGCHMVVVIVSVYHFMFVENEYTRRMDWTGLIQTLERKVQEPDCVVVYQQDIEDLSLRRVSIWDRGIKMIKLKHARLPGTSNSEYAFSLHQSVSGTIFVVNNETDRHVVDPNSELILTLGKLRSISHKRFGRNLILYSFR